MLEPFTIEYGIDHDGGRYWTITIPHGREWKDQYYALGFEPPNFPVPAICGHVQITKYAVYLADPKGYDAIKIWRSHY